MTIQKSKIPAETQIGSQKMGRVWQWPRACSLRNYYDIAASSSYIINIKNPHFLICLTAERFTFIESQMSIIQKLQQSTDNAQCPILPKIWPFLVKSDIVQCYSFKNQVKVQLNVENTKLCVFLSDLLLCPPSPWGPLF